MKTSFALQCYNIQTKRVKNKTKTGLTGRFYVLIITRVKYLCQYWGYMAVYNKSELRLAVLSGMHSYFMSTGLSHNGVAMRSSDEHGF